MLFSKHTLPHAHLAIRFTSDDPTSGPRQCHFNDNSLRLPSPTLNDDLRDMKVIEKARFPPECYKPNLSAPPLQWCHRRRYALIRDLICLQCVLIISRSSTVPEVGCTEGTGGFVVVPGVYLLTDTHIIRSSWGSTASENERGNSWRWVARWMFAEKFYLKKCVSRRHC